MKDNNSVQYRWYRGKVPTKGDRGWNMWYSRIPSYTFLSGDKNEVWVGFLAVIPPLNCLEITDRRDLEKIDAHRRSINSHPFVFNEKK